MYSDTWSEKNLKKPEEIARCDNTKYWFECLECKHNFRQTPCSKTRGRGCPFCDNKKRCGNLSCEFCLANSCYIYKDIWNYSKNSKKPEEVAISSGTKYWFICKEKGHNYFQRPGDTSNGKGCSECVNKTELKVAEYLREIEVEFKREYVIGDIKRYYDFYLPEYQLIIEVDGDQHFRQVGNWTDHNKTRENDIQKMQTAVKHGISVLRIYQPDIFNDVIDWKEFILSNLKFRSKPELIYVKKSRDLHVPYSLEK